MCGIAGCHGRQDAALLDEMLGRIRHRGPDDEGRFHSQDVSLGHVRLSIVDPNGGHQPIFNEDGTVVVVFNGEIYNHRELRARLKRPHVFKTHTDTEIIVHLYEEMGQDCVRELDGMFAFALYDGRRLLLARDGLGIKPLYIGWNDETLLFASEIKALTGCRQLEPLAPGHAYSTEDGFSRGFFALPDAATDGNVLGEDRLPEILHAIREKLDAAVVKRLMADVPVGVFLSGGLDSSLIAALMKRRIDKLHSFSVGMAGSRDLDWARDISRYLGTVHHEYVYDEEEIRTSFTDVMYHLESFDAPLARSAFPCYFVARLARTNGVKVILTGEGADELFGGYRYLGDIRRPEELFEELKEITSRLHCTNLQRVDRMSMAWGVECRVPFLDMDFLRLAFAIDPKLKRMDEKRPEKWLLREAFRGYLPDNALQRRKEKFSEGAGSLEITRRLAENMAGEEEIAAEAPVRSREELGYYRVFRRFYPAAAEECAGRTRNYDRAGVDAKDFRKW